MIEKKLIPPQINTFYTEAGRVTKHHSTSNYLDAVNFVVFAVSEDDPISPYFRGKLLARKS